MHSSFQLHDLLNMWKRGQQDQDNLVYNFIQTIEDSQAKRKNDELTLLISALKKLV